MLETILIPVATLPTSPEANSDRGTDTQTEKPLIGTRATALPKNTGVFKILEFGKIVDIFVMTNDFRDWQNIFENSFSQPF